jgi:hypothetical protein
MAAPTLEARTPEARPRMLRQKSWPDYAVHQSHPLAWHAAKGRHAAAFVVRTNVAPAIP